MVCNMAQLADFVSMVKLQDIILDGIINAQMLPVLSAYGPTPITVKIVEQVCGMYI